jgi:hypothetical protein
VHSTAAAFPARAHWVVDRRPEDGGHHEVPPPAPEVVQRRRHVRPVELRLYLHAERAAGGGGAGEEEVHEAVDVDAVQSEAHVEVHPVLELVDLEQGGYGGELGRAGNEGHRFGLGDLRSSFVRTAVAASEPELDGKQCREDERENWEGRLERAVAGGQEELEHAQPSEEEARRAPDVGREGERQGSCGEEHDRAAKRGKPGRRRDDAPREYSAAADTKGTLPRRTSMAVSCSPCPASAAPWGRRLSHPQEADRSGNIVSSTVVSSDHCH